MTPTFTLPCSYVPYTKKERQNVPEWIALFYVIKAIFYLICIIAKHLNS